MSCSFTMHIFSVQQTHDNVLLAHWDDILSVMSCSGSWIQMQHKKLLYIHGQRGEVFFFFFNSHSLLLCAWLLGEYSKFPQVLLSAITQKSSFVLRLCRLLSLYFSSQLWSEPFPSVGLVCTDVGFTPLETVIFLLPVLSGGGSS